MFLLEDWGFHFNSLHFPNDVIIIGSLFWLICDTRCPEQIGLVTFKEQSNVSLERSVPISTVEQQRYCSQSCLQHKQADIDSNLIVHVLTGCA